jgi:hypothetical protein
MPTWGHSVKLRSMPQAIHRWESVSYPGLPGALRHSVKLRSMPQAIHRRDSVSHPGLSGVLHITPPNYGLYPRIHRCESVSHSGLPGALHHSVKLRSIPQDTSLRERVPSRPTWGIASLRQTTDYTSGSIAQRACPIQAYLGYYVTPSN